MTQTITIDFRMYNSSGIGWYLQKILPYIIDAFRAHFILLGSKKTLESFNSYKNFVIKNFDSSIYSIKGQIDYLTKIPPCDLFWFPHFNVPLLPIKAKKKLVTIHDAYHLAFAHNLSLKERLYANVVYNSALRMSDKVITVLNFSKKELIRYTGYTKSDKIEVIHNGVDVPTSNDCLQNNNNQQEYLLFVGNVKPHNNLKNALLGYLMYMKKNSNQRDLKFIIFT